MSLFPWSVEHSLVYHSKETETAFSSLHHIYTCPYPNRPLTGPFIYIVKSRERSKGTFIFKFWDWRNLFAFLTHFNWWANALKERGAQKPPKSKDTLIIMKARKKKWPDLTGQHTPTYTIHSYHIYHVHTPWYPSTVSCPHTHALSHMTFHS